MEKHAGQVKGRKKATEGLVQLMRQEFNVPNSEAVTALEATLGKTLEYSTGPAGKTKQPTRTYFLKSKPLKPPVIPCRGTGAGGFPTLCRTKIFTNVKHQFHPCAKQTKSKRNETTLPLR